jgi:hypothetical protein
MEPGVHYRIHKKISWLCPEPLKSNLGPHTVFYNGPFYCYISIYIGVSQIVYSDFQSKILKAFQIWLMPWTFNLPVFELRNIIW